jgi:hypothetical protein
VVKGKEIISDVCFCRRKMQQTCAFNVYAGIYKRRLGNKIFKMTIEAGFIYLVAKRIIANRNILVIGNKIVKNKFWGDAQSKYTQQDAAGYFPYGIICPHLIATKLQN